MKRFGFAFLTLALLSSGLIAQAQTHKHTPSAASKAFDKKEALKMAELRYPGRPAMQKEYVEGLIKKHALDQSNPVVSATQAYTFTNDAQKGPTIGLNPANANCPNMGFEQQNFTNWLGDTWTLTGINWLTAPVWTPGFASWGTNNPAQPYSAWGATTEPRHTILTIPPTVNNPPATCIGWDSIAISPITHTSIIPFIPPFGSGVTCRLGNAATGAKTERMRYSLNVNANNSNVTIAYAIVLQDPGHGVNEQPAFQINVTDQNGNPIPGCGNYQVDATLAATDPTFILASYYDTFGQTWVDPGTANYWDPRRCKPWTLVGIDLSLYVGTTINIEVRTFDCSASGHYGYAYVDVNCSPAQAFVNMCSGNNVQSLVAPQGFTQYQWYGPNNQAIVIPAPAGTDDTLNITNGVIGTSYWVQCISASGCTTMMQAILQYGSTDVIATNATPSCAGGNSGTAAITPTGSPTGTYTYAWINSLGQPVGTTNPATGLPPGNYTVTVAAPGCGQKDTVVTVPIAPPFSLSTTVQFCGNIAQLTTPPGATNIQWWGPTGLIPAPIGTAVSYTVTGAAQGQFYAAVYDNQGCRDSLKFNLSPVAGGYVSTSNIVNVCIGGTNGQATIDLTPATNGPYFYTITGAGPPPYNNSLPATNNVSVPLTGLSQGTYNIFVSDSNFCFYSATFKIDTIGIPVTVSASPLSYCQGLDTTQVLINFLNGTPTTCALSTTGCTTASNNYQVGTNQFQNTNWDWPAPYGNWYQNSRHQMLYLASELQAMGMTAGKINSLQFNVTATNAMQALPNFRVSIGCTNLNVLPTVQWSSTVGQNWFQTGLTQVWNNAGNFVPTVGWNNHVFTTPYEWDGVSNIIVETCYDITAGYTSNCSMQQTFTPFISTIVLYNDPTMVCNNPPTATWSWENPIDWTSSQNLRPVIQFGWCSAQATPAQFTFNWTPGTGFIGNPQPTTAPTSTVLISPNATTNYSLTTTTNIGGCSKVDVFTVTIVQPFTISLSIPDSMLCTNDGPTTITAITTPNTPGVWTGNGITANLGNGQGTFDPTAAIVGQNAVTFSGGVAGCNNDTTINMYAHPWVNPTWTPIANMCEYDPPVNLVATTPGGTWYIDGILNAAGVYNPQAQTPITGIHNIYYQTMYVDPVTQLTYCRDSVTSTVSVNPKPFVVPSVDHTTGCIQLASTMLFSSTLNAPSVAGGNYLWNFGDLATSSIPNPVHVYNTASTYTVSLTYTDPNGCIDDSIVNAWITIYPKPYAAFIASNYNPTILEPNVSFQNTSTGAGNTWFWDIAGLQTSTQTNPNYTFASAGLYEITLVATNQYGCVDSVTQFVKVEPDYVFYVPNAFTPNNDGKNDSFFAQGFGIEETTDYKMLIFDRWGEKVFETATYGDGWKGTKNNSSSELPVIDTYVYKISYKDMTGKAHIRTGHVTVVK